MEFGIISFSVLCAEATLVLDVKDFGCHVLSMIYCGKTIIKFMR